MLLKEIKVGDEITRMLAGTIPMNLIVTKIDDKFIYCGEEDEGWKFDINTGGEVDECLGWDGINTGSFIKLD